MAIQQQKKESDIEKRLRLLRRQVYTLPASKHDGKIINPAGELVYFKRDLLKILIFSSVAIGAQIILFFLMKNNISNINF